VRLLIISNMAHFRRGPTIVGWGPAVLEIDALASKFSSVRHIACLHEGEPPPSMLPYGSSNVTVVPVPPAGGASVWAKLGVVRETPAYLRAIWTELREADAVHVRGPANVAIFGVLALAARRRPTVRWVKYAGDWNRRNGEPASYALQRWALRHRLHHGAVTVNGTPTGPRAHIYALLNPCLWEQEVVAARAHASSRTLTQPIRLIFVGRVEEAKGAHKLAPILGELRRADRAFCLDIVGDGPERARVDRDFGLAGLRAAVCWHGWLPRPAISALYREAHVQLLPSATEGWPKVLSEGMAYGVVPVASAVGSIPEVLNRLKSGRALDSSGEGAFADAIASYVDNPETWRSESTAALLAASQFTYETYVEGIAAMIRREFGVDLV